MSGSPQVADGVPAEMTDLLIKALRALGKAGEPDRANRIAGRAWWVLREAYPREAERINGAMHFLARLPDKPGEACATPPATGDSDRPATGDSDRPVDKPGAATPAAP